MLFLNPISANVIPLKKKKKKKTTILISRLILQKIFTQLLIFIWEICSLLIYNI